MPAITKTPPPIDNPTINEVYFYFSPLGSTYPALSKNPFVVNDYIPFPIALDSK